MWIRMREKCQYKYLRKNVVRFVGCVVNWLSKMRAINNLKFTCKKEAPKPSVTWRNYMLTKSSFVRLCNEVSFL
jgi:hypothetical protein